MPDIVFVSTTQAFNQFNAGFDTQLGVPAAGATGDLLLAALNPFGGTMTTPSGWTLVSLVSGFANFYVFSHICTASEPAFYTFTQSASNFSTRSICVRYTNNATAAVNGGTASNSGISRTGPGIGALDTNYDRAMSIAIWGGCDGSQTITSNTAPTGYTMRAYNDGSGNGVIPVGLSDKLITPIGPAGSWFYTIQDSSFTTTNWNAVGYVINPPPVAPQVLLSD